MINYMIFDEFLENGEGTLGYQFRSLYLFFSMSKLSKKIDIKILMISTCEKNQGF